MSDAHIRAQGGSGPGQRVLGMVGRGYFLSSAMMASAMTSATSAGLAPPRPRPPVAFESTIIFDMATRTGELAGTGGVSGKERKNKE